MKMNLPNKLTLLRLLMVPFFMVAMALPELIELAPAAHNTCNIIGVSLFILASVTDFLDGMIARKKGLVTNFGKFMDPLADKLMVIGAMLMILYKSDYEFIHPLFIWTTVAVIFRELTVTGIRLLAVQGDGKVIAANILGKIKTVSQIVLILWLMLLGRAAFAPFISTVLILWTAAITLWSGADYLIKNKDVIKNA